LLMSIALIMSGCSQPRQSESVGLIIQKSYEAHGGVYATDSLKIAFQFSIPERTNELQSLTPFPPFETYTTNEQIWIDKPAGKELHRQKSTTAGFIDEHVSYLKNGEGHDVNVTFKTYSPVTSLPSPRSLLHHAILKDASSDTSKVKWAAYVVAGNKNMYHILADTIHLFINRDNYLLERLERPIQDAVYGKGTQVIEFGDYIKVGRASIPQTFVASRITSIYDTITNRCTLFNITADFEVPQNEFTIPADFKPIESNYREGEILKLGPSLYFMENINGPGGPYHALIAEFGDFILITEAPVDRNVSKKVIQKAKETIPGKPVRYLVQSHHHNDHIGGVLGYVAEGVTVVTTKDAAWLIREMSKVFANSIGSSVKDSVIEQVNGQWNIKDRMNECITADIGPTSHSRQILITYFPKQKVLFQADLEIRDAEFIKKVRDLNWDVEILVNAHDKIIKGEEIKTILK
jgi:Metallo-beta-lactamase superfamily